LLAELATGWEEHLARKRLRLTLAPTTLCGFTDPAMLGTIVRNLMGNAIKYTLAGGRIVIGCRRRGTSVSVEVWDTGIGIPEAEQARIFEAFRQVEPECSEGLGMGLAIVRQTATMLGHEVGVRSRVGRGSVFSVTLPRAI
jgi:signal transduction histidine kinase